MSTAFGDTIHTGLGTNGFEVSLNYITGIPDPNHLVCSNTLKLAFKSLLKRDVNTKEKSIVNLFEYIRDHPSELNDDLLIIAWVQMYPKLSLDDSKKVRSISHQIQAQFVSTLGKSYAKYLKDTVGIWLSGLFDSDRSTAKCCKESLDFAFAGNTEKISNLWKIFTYQILQFTHQVLAYETKDTLSDERFASKDESESKYLRVLQASILLLVHTVKELNSIEVTEKISTLLSSIYNQEVLFEAFNSKDFNLKKSAYISFKTLVTSKHVTSIINKQSYKALSKAMIKGIKFDYKINPLLYSGIIISILDTLVCVTLYDSTFWINIKKSDNKLLSVLKLGSLNSEPIYYDIVNKLFKILPSDFVSLDKSETFEPYYVALLESVEKEKSIEFLEKGWKVVISLTQTLICNKTITNLMLDKFTFTLIKFLDSPRLISPVIKKLMHEIHTFANDDKDVLLDINSIVMDALPNKPILFVDYNEYKISHTHKFVESFIEILSINKSDLEEVLLANAIESIEESASLKEDPTLSFFIVNIFTKKGSKDYVEPIDSFMKTVPNYITETFVDQPLETLNIYSHSTFANDSTINTLINESFIKLNELNLASKLLKLIPKLGHFNIHETKEFNEFLIQHSKSIAYDSNDDANAETDHSALYEFLTLEILCNLYDHEKFSFFVANCCKHYNNELFIEFSKKRPDFIEKLIRAYAGLEPLSKFQHALDLLEKLQENLQNDETFAAVFKDSVLRVAENDDMFWHKLGGIFSDFIINSILGMDILEEFGPVFSKAPQKLLSLASSVDSELYNSVDLALYMFVESGEADIDFIAAKKYLNKASFYCALLKQHISSSDYVKNIIDISLVAEFGSDFLFLQSSDSDSEILQEKFLSDLVKPIRSLLLEIFRNFTYKDLFDALLSNSSNSPFLNHLLSLVIHSNKTVSYYSHRILKLILTEKADSLSSKDFESFDFRKLAEVPSLLYIILGTCKRYLTSKNLEVVRTNTVASLINIRKSTDICSSGLNNLILLNAFIDIDLDCDIPENLNMIAPQRCLMLLNTLTDWLECEVAYDDIFQPVRITMMQFVQHYINSIYCVCDNNYPSDFINKIFSLGTRLVSETINLIENEDEISLDLLYASLRLYLLLNKFKSDIETWEEDCSETEDEILSLFFKFSAIKEVNEPVNLVCAQFSKILNEVKNDTLGQYYEKIYTLLLSQNIQLQRIGCTLLHKLIPEVQDNLVVEFALSKKKADEEGNSGIHLPSVLLDVTRTPLVDYIEFESPWKVYQYLWSWYLVMDHFKNITQQMRQDYINDLGEAKVANFLNFIFSELDINKFKISEDEQTYVKDYSFDDNSILCYTDEIRKLSVNLVYEIMNNIGGTFAQNWFNSIKDKQLKQHIEKFIISFISPQLINDILSTLSNKNSIEDSEFKVNINKKTNEIKCLYNIDEQDMEISITLPVNFPLSQISVNGISRIGVAEKKWKSWIMSTQYVINFQNGTILDAIKHFKDNVTANFENYDDCAICYSILNAVDHSTPNKVCPTCKHNFHSACLYRWFKSSGSSTCPLCRSKFNFKKHS